MTQSMYVIILINIGIQSSDVLLRRILTFFLKQEWVPKVSKTNPQGIKVMWVLKTKV